MKVTMKSEVKQPTISKKEEEENEKDKMKKEVEQLSSPQPKVARLSSVVISPVEKKQIEEKRNHCLDREEEMISSDEYDEYDDDDNDKEDENEKETNYVVDYRTVEKSILQSLTQIRCESLTNSKIQKKEETSKNFRNKIEISSY